MNRPLHWVECFKCLKITCGLSLLCFDFFSLRKIEYLYSYKLSVLYLILTFEFQILCVVVKTVFKYNKSKIVCFNLKYVSIEK